MKKTKREKAAPLPSTLSIDQEAEKKRRIKLTMWAFAYEILFVSIVDDHTFDMECQKIDLTISTGNEVLDKWWVENFDPSTGMWIHRHPDLVAVERFTNEYIQRNGVPK